MRISDWSSDVCSSDLRPVKRAGKANLGISPHQPVARRAITDHDLRSGMTASEERLDILLDRNASDIELDRPRHRLEVSARRGFGVETVEIDTATPQTGPTQPMREIGRAHV